MDAGIIASVVTTLFSPFISKIGEKVSEKFGEDIYPIIRPYFIEEDEQKSLDKISSNPTQTEVETFNNLLTSKLKQNTELQNLFLEKLNLNSYKGAEVVRIVRTMQQIQNNIEDYTEMYESAGVGTSGDIQVVLLNEKRKYQKLYSELLKTLKF